MPRCAELCSREPDTFGKEHAFVVYRTLQAAPPLHARPRAAVDRLQRALKAGVRIGAIVNEPATMGGARLPWLDMNFSLILIYGLRWTPPC